MNSLFLKIADGLAENSYSIVDHFLQEEQLMAILQLDEFKQGLLHFTKAGIGKGDKHKVNENIRGDYVQWIDPESTPPPIKVYTMKVRELMSFINENLFLSLKDFEAHLTRYPAGKGYDRHLDQFKKDDHRKLSIIYYLNKDWQVEDGGQLRMHLNGGPVDVLPLANRLVCFRSDVIEHEVLPSGRERLSITGWILDRLSGVNL